MTTDTLWRRSAVECLACGYRWEAVTEGVEIPAGLECPACSQWAGNVPSQEEYEEWNGYEYRS